MRRDVRQVAVWAAEQPECPPEVASAARRLLSKPRRIARKVPAVERAAERKAAAEKARRAELDLIIPAIQKRSGGQCEWCLGEGHHFHHMLQGSQRRKRESVETMVLLCRSCHDRYHAAHVTTLGMAWCWAEKHSTPEVVEMLHRRITKSASVRRTA